MGQFEKPCRIKVAFIAYDINRHFVENYRPAHNLGVLATNSKESGVLTFEGRD